MRKGIIILFGILLLSLNISCGKKSDSEPQQSQGIVPASVFAQIPGNKIGK